MSSDNLSALLLALYCSPRRSFEDILQSGAQRCAFQGFAPDGSLLVQVNRGGGDIYALTVGIP